MSEILPILSPHSQFPYPYDKPTFVSYCRMRCGRFNQWKRRYVAISRNCVYYFKNQVALLDEKTEGHEEYLLAVGVIPLYHCLVRKEERKSTEVELSCAVENVSMRYIRILSEKMVIVKSKERFCFEFCKRRNSNSHVAVEEEAAYFVECIQDHLAETHPYDAIMAYEIEFSIMSLRELKLIEEETSILLKELKREKSSE